MSEHFSLAEFVRSDVAIRKGIDNSLPKELAEDAAKTIEMMERIRQHLCRLAQKDIPIHISSGYRCKPLNAAVGSSPTSDHIKASAVDFTAPRFGTPVQICNALAPHVSVLGIGQLIHEFGQWVHTSWRVPMQPINRVITISHAGIVPGIQEA